MQNTVFIESQMNKDEYNKSKNILLKWLPVTIKLT